MIERLRRSGTSISTRSPCVSINQCRLRSTPARERLSSSRTRCPAESMRCARFEPTKPAPPVIKIGLDLDFPLGWPGVGSNVFKFLRLPLPLPGALLFPLVIAEPLDRSLPPVWVLPRLRKVHGDQRDIRTPAYLHPIKLKTVKILLGSCVSAFDLAAHFVVLGCDDGIA